MNCWAVTVALLFPPLLLCAWRSLYGTPERRLVGLMMTGSVVTIIMIALSVLWRRSTFLDLPLALAIMGLGSTFLFARFLEKHL